MCDCQLPDKVAFVLIDGIGDVSIPSLNFQTPLEVAETPILDAIAAGGFNGLLDPVEPGLACGSDTAHMSLFGYDPRLLYRGRGAFESMGAGLDMQPGDIAFKSNFATVDKESGTVLRRRADRQFEKEGPELCAALDGLSIPGFPQHSMSVKYATEHRCGVVIRGPGLTDAISGTDPLKDNLPLLSASPLDRSPEASLTSSIVNAASQAISDTLENHPVNVERRAQGKAPANVVLLRGCGCRLALTPFSELHSMRGAMLSPTKIIAGLGMCAGIDVLIVPGTTGDYKTQFHLKAEAIAKTLSGGGGSDGGHHDFAFLHVKAVDDAGHDGSVELKIAYLKAVDLMVGQLVRLLWESEEAEEREEQEAHRNGNLEQGTSEGTSEGATEEQAEHQQQHHHHQQQQQQKPPRRHYSIVVTGDHSTPVQFGDHSHEPVPFAISRVCDVVHALGGDVSVRNIPLGPIPHPAADGGGGGGVGESEVASVENIGSVIKDNIYSITTNGTTNGNTKINGTTNGTTINISPIISTPSLNSTSAAAAPCGGDSVCRFSELDAAEGSLGRFPGSQVFNVIKEFAGVS